jgi:LmbE family N-acetylglucosaminyl deacetylase
MQIIKYWLIEVFMWVGLVFHLINYLLDRKESKKLVSFDIETYPDGKILIVTAHPDDEIFSLCNLISIIDNKENITWLNVTSGQNSYSSTMSKREMAIARDTELHQSAKYLRIGNVINLKIDCYMDSNKAKTLSNYLISMDEYKLVFVMHHHDNHIDHRLVSKVVQGNMPGSIIYGYNIIQNADNAEYTHKFMYDDLLTFDRLSKIYSSQSHMKHAFRKHKYMKILQKMKSRENRYSETLIMLKKG